MCITYTRIQKAEHAGLVWDSRFLSRLCDPERNRVTGQKEVRPARCNFIHSL